MSRYRIEFLKTVQKELLKLPKEIQQRIAAKLDALLSDPYPPLQKPKSLKTAMVVFEYG